jgi:GNAT superfamily N-acetyltransferase
MEPEAARSDPSLHVGRAAGRAYLDLVSRLLQRARQLEPSGGLWEAADFQWWWRRDQYEDPTRQTFWLDRDMPVAAVVFTNWGDYLQLDPLVLERDQASLGEVVWERALDRLSTIDDVPVDVIARDDDAALVERLDAAGFRPAGEVGVTTLLAAGDRPKVPPLPEGFRLLSRSDTPTKPHPMVRRNGVHVAERLRECSLYRPDLDLAVCAPHGDVAGYALFWADPITRVGLVEPMRTEERYQGRGIARHLLAEGLERLAASGCSVLKVTYIEGNEPARRLYLGAGFRPDFVSRTYRRTN